MRANMAPGTPAHDRFHRLITDKLLPAARAVLPTPVGTSEDGVPEFSADQLDAFSQTLETVEAIRVRCHHVMLRVLSVPPPPPSFWLLLLCVWC